MATTNADVEALENALLAIDTSVRTLMMARQIIEDRLPGGRIAMESSAPAVMGQESQECEHLLVKEISTMGRTISVCKNPECGEVVQ